MQRSERLYQGTGQLIEQTTAPPIWPVVLLSGLHYASMAMAMMIWINVCRMANPVALVPSEDGEIRVDSETQTLYSRLLVMNAVCEFITSQLVGGLSDQYGRKLLAISSQLGQVVDYFTAGLALAPMWFEYVQTPTFLVTPSLFFCRGLAGLLGNVRIAMGAYIADISTPAECPVRLAFSGAAMTIGFMLGPVVVVFVHSMNWSYRVLMWSATSLNLLNIALIHFAWTDVAPTKKFQMKDANPVAGIHVLSLTPALPVCGLMTFLDAFSLNIFTGTFAFYCESVLRMGKTPVTLLSLVFGTSSAAWLGHFGPKFMETHGEIAMLKFGYFCTIVFYLALSVLTPSTSYVFFFIVVIFSLGMIKTPITTALAAREVDPQQQGSLQGALSLLETIGKIVAPLLAGEFLIPMFNQSPDQFHGMVYFIAALVIMPGLALAFYLGAVTTDHEVPEKEDVPHQTELSNIKEEGIEPSA